MSKQNKAPEAHIVGNRKQRRAAARIRARVSRRVGSAAATGAALALGFGAHAVPARADTYTVTNTNDSGAGSLRDAVTQANGHAGADIIAFSGVTGTITLTSGEIPVTTGALDIQGPGSPDLTVSGNNASRVFNANNSSGDAFSISGLTITGGNTTSGGGGILSADRILTLDDIVLTGNHANGVGGGLQTYGYRGVTIRDSQISNNTTSSSGGGIYINYLNTAGLLLENTKVTGNQAVSGGGLWCGTIISGSSTIRESTFSGNTASSAGGGLFINYLGGYLSGNGSLQIVDTTISGNTTTAGAGGGMRFDRVTGTLLVQNSTVSGNQSSAEGGGIRVTFQSPGPRSVQIKNSTIVANSASTGSSLWVSNGTVNILHSILSATSGTDVAVGSGGLFAINRSLVKTPGAVALGGTNNITGSDPLLGTLQDNGGPTLTHLPSANSPVVNAGDPAFSPPPLLDQRGYTRALGVIDMGSVELAQTLQWSAATDTVAEAGGTITLTATRLGGSVGAVSVNYATMPGTASGTDFTPATGTFNWADGDTAAKTVVITIGDDSLTESSEMFTVVLSNVTGGAALGTNSTITVTITDDDPAPTISVIGDQTINEDAAVTALPFTVDDVDDGTAGLVVSATSSNTTLVPNGNVVLGGSGGTRTISVTPVANASGDTTITVSASDGFNTTTRTFDVHVTAVNDAPTVSSISNQTIGEDAATSVLGFTVGDQETAAASLIVTATSSNTTLIPDNQIALGGSGASRTIQVTPAANLSSASPVTITVNVSDGTTSTPTTFTVTVNPVNDPPTIASIQNQATDEDTQSAAIGITVGDIDSDVDAIVLTGASSDTSIVADSAIVFGGSGTSRTVRITPVANANGPVGITVTATDSSTATAARSFTITVNAVNDAPTVSSISDATIDEDTPSSAIGFTIGDVETAAGSLTVSAVSNNQSVVANGSIVLGGSGASRTVTVTPVANASGAATITITVGDGTTTTPRSFVVNVTAVNDQPTISAISDQSVAEDTQIGPLGITLGDDGSSSSLTLSAISSDQAIVANSSITFGGSGTSRTVTVTPVANASGTATITVTVSDGLLTNTSDFDVTLAAVDDAPTITAISDQSIDEDDTTGPLAFTIADPDNTLSGLTITATSSNQGLVPNANVVLGGSGASRTVTVTPASNQSGTTTITVSANDDNSTTTRTFDVVVGALNDTPTITSIADQLIDENSVTESLAFTIGDVETAAGSLVVTAESSNQGLVPDGNIVLAGSGANRTVTVTPLAAMTGTATITISVDDGTSTSNRSFDLVVSGAPVVSSIADQSLDEDGATAALAFTVADAETAAADLLVSAASSNTALIEAGGIVLDGSGTNRTVQVTPLANHSGTTDITISVSDGTHVSTETFAVSVAAVADAPVISAISDLTTPEGAATGAIAFTLSDADTDLASLVVTAASSNQALVPNGNIVLAGSGAERTLTVTPSAYAHGETTITLSVADGASTVTRSFKLTVSSVNDLPTLSSIEDQTIDEGTVTGEIAFTVGDPDGVEGLTITATSSSQVLLSDDGIVIEGTGTDRTVKLTPSADRDGSTTVTITVSDGTASASTSFWLNVTPVFEPSQPDAGETMQPSTPADAGIVDEEPNTPAEESDAGRLRIGGGSNCSVSQPGGKAPASGSLVAGFLGLIAFGARRRRRNNR
jgi:MYXO-CTERM domain-containing protein